MMYRIVTINKNSLCLFGRSISKYELSVLNIVLLTKKSTYLHGDIKHSLEINHSSKSITSKFLLRVMFVLNELEWKTHD